MTVQQLQKFLNFMQWRDPALKFVELGSIPAVLAFCASDTALFVVDVELMLSEWTRDGKRMTRMQSNSNSSRGRAEPPPLPSDDSQLVRSRHWSMEIIGGEVLLVIRMDGETAGEIGCIIESYCMHGICRRWRISGAKKSVAGQLSLESSTWLWYLISLLCSWLLRPLESTGTRTHYGCGIQSPALESTCWSMLMSR